MKTVLLAVCGLSPQIITETLYALHQQGQRIDAVRILTTRAGKDACIASLFRDGDGHWRRYLDEYGLAANAPDFSPRSLLAVADAQGREMDDISSENDSERFLRACMEQAFELTRHADQRVLFSIAGGRKTMGACLALAAQCYGRSQDRVYHVLVQPTEFEGCRDFFFPPRPPRLLEVRNREGRPCFMDSAQAEVTLVPMPFFSLRGHLTPSLLRQPENPATLMLSLVREDKPELTVDLREKNLVWKKTECDLSAAPLALYALLALHKQQSGCTHADCQNCRDCFLTPEQILERQDELTRLYRRLTTREPVASGITGLDTEYFQSYRSKINRAILLCFGDHEGRQLSIERVGERPNSRYGILLDRRRIKVVL